MNTQDDQHEKPHTNARQKAATIANFLLKFLPLLTVVGFGFSSYLLLCLFSAWRLNFSQLADPADVVFPGLLMTLALSIVAALFFSAGSIIDAFMECLSEDRRIWARVSLLAFAAIGAVVVARLSGLAAVDRWNGLGACALLAVGTAGSTLIHSRKATKNRIGIAAVVISLGIVSYLAALCYGGFIQFFSEAGFVSGAWVQKNGDKVPCDGQVLWLGAKSTIIRCAAAQHMPSPLVILTSHDGMILHPTRPAPAKAPPPVPKSGAKATAAT